MFGRVEPPLSGIYKDTPEDEYHNWDCFSYSMVKGINRSMLHLAQWMEEDCKKLKDKKHVQNGNIVETLVFEPELFDEKFKLFPKTCKRQGKKKGSFEEISFSLATKDGKQIKADIEESGKMPITEDQYFHANKAVEALKNHEIANDLLFRGTNQLSMVWTDDNTGVNCKCRLDNLDEMSNSIVDLKVTHDAYFPVFIKNIGDMGYHIQAGSYQAATEYYFNNIFTYTIVGVEPTPPYGVTCIPLREDSLELGRKLFAKGLQRYARMSSLPKEMWEGYDVKSYDSDILPYLLNRSEND